MARTVMQPRVPYTCEGVVDKTLPASSPPSRTDARVNTEAKPDFHVANLNKNEEQEPLYSISELKSPP